MTNKADRYFESGAYRDIDSSKIDFEGYLNPLVLQKFGEYMLKHQKQSDGVMRDSDNWQAGIPQEVYVKSLLRHTHDVWMENRGYPSREGKTDAACGVMFNIMGWLLEELKKDLPRTDENKEPNGTQA